MYIGIIIRTTAKQIFFFKASLSRIEYTSLNLILNKSEK